MRYLILLAAVATFASSCNRIFCDYPWGQDWTTTVQDNVWYNRTIEPLPSRGLTRFQVIVDLSSRRPLNNFTLNEVLPAGATIVKQPKCDCDRAAIANKLTVGWATFPVGKQRLRYEIEVPDATAGKRFVQGYFAPAGIGLEAYLPELGTTANQEAWERNRSGVNGSTVVLESTAIDPIDGIRLVSTNVPN